MRFYAERPGRLARQLVADLLVIAWVVVCVRIARDTYATLQQLAAPGRALIDAGGRITGAFDDAAATVAKVPFVGDALARALASGSTAGSSLTQAGREQVETAASVALGNAVAVVALFALPVVVLWLALRIRYARLASAAAAIRNIDTDLLALRALSRVRVNRLLAVSPDPAGAWRRGDRAAVHALAGLELRSLGLREPRVPPPD